MRTPTFDTGAKQRQLFALSAAELKRRLESPGGMHK